ncbi:MULTISPECIES: hypothetical protein [Streptomyces]|uniref:Uncharacterized protein n=1 Tax=Streptomyces hirsutus TaxID=35620 RepID=A0ABZ1GJA6_9ACTN|nr:hypothetical protein [Streptomyces hirsutus]WSD06239.1 hypothetical protein OIE73_10940 [Streptomyces hirsutus]WTD74741.1 hypothetical protein OHB56_12845 [Streptomyces sp. NBC_01635]
MLKRQYWGMTVLLVTLAFSYVGYRLNDGSPSTPWTIGGLAAGVTGTAVLARAGKK